MIGKMRQKITFKAPTATPVGGGGVETTYSEVLTDWCEAIPLKSSRELAEYQTIMKSGYSFEMRNREGFTPDDSMLVVYKGGEYTINGIEDVNEEQRFWRIIGMHKG